MRELLIASAIVVVELASLFILLAPVIYVPAIQPTEISGGLGAHYISISCYLAGEGGLSFIGTPYQFVSNPQPPGSRCG
jgi:hypothetical protein